MTSRPVRDLEVLNFKSFSSLKLALGRLTVLTGTNSSGKSTVIQALALLEQSRDQEPAGLILNGPLVELGTFEDLLFDRVGEDLASDVAVSIGFRPTTGRWLRFAGVATSQADFVPLADGVPPLRQSVPWKHLAYIRADRLGPTLLHQKSHTAVVRDSDIGARGEFAVHFLLSRGDTAVSAPMCLSGTPATLESQCGAWLERLSIDTRLYVSDVKDTGNATLRFSDGALTGLSSGRAHRSTNVGFGLSYVLPVIVACLAAKRGDLVLLENPEAHLHPRGQAVIAELCAKAAQAGAQVVIETHSDHVLNRVRLAVATSVLRPADVAIHFFRRGAHSTEPIVDRLPLDERGQFTLWPDGFFDEYMNALLELADYD